MAGVGKQTHLYHMQPWGPFLPPSLQVIKGHVWHHLALAGRERLGLAGGLEEEDAVVDSPGGPRWEDLGNCQIRAHKVKPGGGRGDGYDVRSFLSK